MQFSLSGVNAICIVHLSVTIMLLVILQNLTNSFSASYRNTHNEFAEQIYIENSK